LDSKLVEAILRDAVAALNDGAWRPPGGGATASAFEKEARRQLELSALAHGVRNEVILHSGRKFPDIVFKDSAFGVEIKTAQKGWSCLGNSVAASTLVDGVSQVYLLFGSGESSFEAKFARYEDAVRSVEVTHSPRYVLDMDVPPGGSYFQRIGKDLADMLAMDDPISCVVEEARRNLRPGEHLWWISAGMASPMTIRLWSKIDAAERRRLISSAFAFFPVSILSCSEADYSDFVVWLSQKHSILHPCVRDSFTAGGRVSSLEFGAGVLEDVPKVFKTLHRHISEIIDTVIIDVSPSDWAWFYRCSEGECDTPVRRFRMWRAVVEPLLIDRSGGQEYSIQCIRSFLDNASRRLEAQQVDLF
jgi:hypothetical protein